MKVLSSFILLPLIFIVSCTSVEENTRIPFELQPDGLKKKIKGELITKSKEEIKASMQEIHEIYSNFYVMDCWDQRLELIIRKNNSNQIMVRSKIISSKEEIQDAIFLYFTANADLNQAQIEKNIRDPKYKYFRHPFFNTVKLSYIEEKIEENTSYLNSVLEKNDPNLVRLYTNSLNDWKKKEKAIHALELDEIYEIQHGTGIVTEDATNKEDLSSLTEEAIRGILNVRDHASQKYFSISYLALYFDATRHNDEKAQKRVDAIDHLYQMRIVDESYARSKGLLTKRNQYKEPPIEIKYASSSPQKNQRVEATPPSQEPILEEEK